MGGLGSGNWHRWEKRRWTVEESLSLAMRDFRGRIHPYSKGSLCWERGGRNTASIGYSVTWDDTPTIRLRYSCHGADDVQIPVHLQSTPTQFGGQRWWFTCPLLVDDQACNRRVGKLHLPPGAKYFGCRKCHDLTYRICQEAHQEERLFASIGRMEAWQDTLKSRQR